MPNSEFPRDRFDDLPEDDIAVDMASRRMLQIALGIRRDDLLDRGIRQQRHQGEAACADTHRHAITHAHRELAPR